MHAVNYRCAIPSDAAAIIGFQLAMAKETENIQLDSVTCTAGVSAVFADAALGRYFVADISGEIGASLLITFEWSDWRNGNVWWIQSVYVRPEFRGQSIFRGLFQHVREIAAAEPTVRGLRLYVDRRNERAKQVYRRLEMDGDHYQVFEWMKRPSGSASLL